MFARNHYYVKILFNVLTRQYFLTFSAFLCQESRFQWARAAAARSRHRRFLSLVLHLAFIKMEPITSVHRHLILFSPRGCGARACSRIISRDTVRAGMRGVRAPFLSRTRAFRPRRDRFINLFILSTNSAAGEASNFFFSRLPADKAAEYNRVEQLRKKGEFLKDSLRGRIMLRVNKQARPRQKNIGMTVVTYYFSLLRFVLARFMQFNQKLNESYQAVGKTRGSSRRICFISNWNRI